MINKNRIIFLFIAIMISINIPLKYSSSDEGLLIFNLTKDMVFFIHQPNLNKPICDNDDRIILRDLKGFQFIRNEDVEKFSIREACHVISTEPDSSYSEELRNWYVDRTFIYYSYKESLFKKIYLMFDFKDFTIVGKHGLLKFQYVERFNLESVRLTPIK